MPAVWKSTHPDVLAWWASVQERSQEYVKVCQDVEKRTGRKVIEIHGWGDPYPAGLSASYSETPPEGWKWGYKDHSYIAPRAKGPGSTEAKALIAELAQSNIRVRTEAQEKFGCCAFTFMGMRVIAPGYWEYDGVLWMFFGTHDYDPPEGYDASVQFRSFFEPAKLSDYHLAREASGELDD